MASFLTLFSPLLTFVISHPEFLLAFFSFILICSHRRSRSGLSNVNYPIVGALPNLFFHSTHLHDWLTDLLCSCNSSVILKGPIFSHSNIILTADPANVRHVFTANFPNYPKGPDLADVLDVLGEGIFAADGEAWRFQRRLAHGLISDVKFKAFAAEASKRKVEGGLIPVLEKKAATYEVFDLQDVFLRLTFDTTSMFVFGVDPGCLTAAAEALPEVAFANAMDNAEEVLFFRHVVPLSWWKLLRWLRVGPERRMAKAVKVIDHFIADYIAKRATELVGGADLVSSYLNCRHEVESLGIDFNKFLRDSTLNFMVAGRDTTSSALTWFFYLLSHHPSVEYKILDELSAFSDLTRLVYLQAALFESLRLFPPVPFEHKAAVEPDILPSGHRVHPRHRILFSLYSMGRIEKVWGKDCHEFKPERWISETGTLRHQPSYKFVSFNSGPRTCLGKDMAFVQMKMVAAAVIARFRVEAAEVGWRVGVPKLSIILHMERGFMVRVKEREKPLVGW
ncbi:hypothetical protein KFK09_026414 [Dendrobium nobile]|uniref:noroxomaritidine synthase n=1 Tax=Dendrobium nobile TaxID=94219 RepID=A0A8T3A7R0_DENNO|nr:hypothetical protein KFK09_026414 [Dendrobium nobile]